MAENITRPSYEKVESKVEVMDTPYDRWISSQGIDVMRGFFVEDLYTLPLKAWDRVGAPVFTLCSMERVTSMTLMWSVFLQARI